MTKSFIILFLVAVSFPAFAYEGPSPLQNVKVEFSISIDEPTGLYSYNYKVANPASNNGEVNEIRISIERDPQTDAEVSSSGFSHCQHHSNVSADRNLALKPMVPVGSASPSGWSCNYMPDGTFTFGALNARSAIKPGAKSAGYTLRSFGLPGIRDVAVEPTIVTDLLPETYNEDAEKLEGLEKRVTWNGKTIGPKAPPKQFIPSNFLNYLISLKDQSVSLGWIGDKGLAKELDATFSRAKRKLNPCDQQELKEAIEKVKDLCDRGRKGLSEEGRVLLLFNAKYFLAQLPKPSKKEKCDGAGEHEHKDDDNKSK